MACVQAVVRSLPEASNISIAIMLAGEQRQMSRYPTLAQYDTCRILQKAKHETGQSKPTGFNSTEALARHRLNTPSNLDFCCSAQAERRAACKDAGPHPDERSPKRFVLGSMYHGRAVHSQGFYSGQEQRIGPQNIEASHGEGVIAGRLS